jgi:hypothetical protein
MTAICSRNLIKRARKEGFKLAPFVGIAKLDGQAPNEGQPAGMSHSDKLYHSWASFFLGSPLWIRDFRNAPPFLFFADKHLKYIEKFPIMARFYFRSDGCQANRWAWVKVGISIYAIRTNREHRLFRRNVHRVSAAPTKKSASLSAA